MKRLKAISAALVFGVFVYLGMQGRVPLRHEENAPIEYLSTPHLLADTSNAMNKVFRLFLYSDTTNTQTSLHAIIFIPLSRKQKEGL